MFASNIFLDYFILLLISFIVFIFSFVFWIINKNNNLKRVMLIVLGIFLLILLLGIFAFFYILSMIMKY